MGIALAGFYYVGRGHWTRLLACLVGFAIARVLVTRLTGPPVGRRNLRRRGSVVRLSPDEIIFWQHGFFKINATIVFTWALMLVLVVGSMLVKTVHRSQAFPLAEPAGSHTRLHDRGANRGSGSPPTRGNLSPFLGTLFLFVALAALCTIFPGYEPPTGSLSTTAALALCVFVAVPLFGISEGGLGNYLKSYIRPTFIMLPFHIISEFSRTLALAVRLFGNMMSGAMIIGILLAITPFVFPIVMTALGLLTGMVQAYIIFILATVYIAAATRVEKTKSKPGSDG